MALAKPEVTKSQIIREFITQNPDMPIADIVARLAETGVDVTKNHVYVVKGKMKTKKRQKRAEKMATAGNGAAKDESAAGSKSAAVRGVLRANRKMKAKEVIAALAEKGISVTEGLVYFVKGKIKGKRGRKKKAEMVVTQAAAITASKNGDPVKTILQVKSWASEVGGLKKLKSLVDALSE